ncbi:MAG: transposase [Planctomycetaceae bacterium]|nr:transposase [Planctomycetaceae bacterium]
MCALIGVVPINCDSGKIRGRRKINGGRKRIRTVLFNAAMAAIHIAKEDNIFKQLYIRMEEKGKAKIAVVHKIARIAHFLTKNKKTWVNNFTQIQ